MHFNKKADLSLSINAIVILILAITMLGLGLAFMKGMFGKVTGELGEMTKGLSAQRKAELENSLDRITFDTSELEIKVGTKANMYFAIRNNLNPDAPNTFNIPSPKDDKGFGFGCTDAINPGGAKEPKPEDIKFSTYTTRTIKAGASEALPLIINVPANAVPTVYSCDLTLEDPSTPGSEYAKKVLYITVTP